MLAVETAIQGWGIVFALLILVGVILLVNVAPQVPWFDWVSLFIVALILMTVGIKW